MIETETNKLWQCNKKWLLNKLRDSLKLNKPYVYFLADNDDLVEIEAIVEEMGYNIFYRDTLFFSTGLFLEKVEK